MSPLGESSSLTSERVSAASDIIDDEFLVVHGALQVVNEHPWGTTSHASAIAFLPAFIGNLLANDGVAHGHDLVSEPAMQALAVGGQLALSGRFAAPAGLVAAALLPP